VANNICWLQRVASDYISPATGDQHFFLICLVFIENVLNIASDVDKQTDADLYSI